MTNETVLIVFQALGIALSGVLAGEEFIVRYGVQPALASLDDRAHVAARIALVKRLKVVVPILMVPTVLIGILVLATTGGGAGIVLRWAGVVALVAFVLFSFLGTVPINIRVNDWDAEAPPADWKAVVHRWEVIDVYRSAAALVAFVCFVIAFAVQLG